MEPLGAHDPEEIGSYRLRARLGAGGMGRVYLAASPGGALVAIKVVHPGFAHDERFRARFRREVEISRRVTGPWVASVVDADPDAEQPWLATQYVRGPSLSAAVEELGPLPAETVQVLAHGLALALGAIHGVGLVHRDLKPSNVLLDADHPRLIDFGISRAVDGTQMTSTGMVVGTPAFMSPEQITGAEVGPASDVFSLGSVLCYAATGRGPFGDTSPVVLMLRISREEPDLVGVPEVLRGPIAACLAKASQDRPTAGELGEMLGPIGGAEPGWLPPRVVALAPGPDQDPTLVERTQDTAASMGEPAGRGPSRRLVLSALGAGAAVLVAGSAVAAATLSRRPESPPGPPAPRVRWTVPVGPGFDGVGASWAVDNRTIYSYSDDHVIRALDTADGAERWSAPGWADGLNEIALVPVGGLLVVGTSVVVAALDATSGQRLWELPRRVDFSHVAVVDGIVLAGWTGGSGVVALDASSGSRLWGGEEPNAFDFAARVAAGGGRGFAIYNSELRALDLRAGKVRWTYDFEDGTGTNVNSRPIVGDDVVFVVTPSAVVAIHTADGSVRWRTPLAMFPPDGAGAELIGDVLAVLTLHDDEKGGLVRGLDAATGAERWTAPSTGPAALWPPYGADGRLYISTDAGSRSSTACYDAVTGHLRWSHENPSPGLLRPVAATGPDVYLLAGDALQAVTAP